MSKMAESDPGPYGGLPGFKVPGTSKDAARAMKPKATVLRDKVLVAIRGAGSRGMTADEAAAAIGEHWSNVRPRCSELRVLGLIRESRQLRRASANGSPAAVWEIVA